MSRSVVPGCAASVPSLIVHRIRRHLIEQQARSLQPKFVDSRARSPVTSVAPQMSNTVMRELILRRRGSTDETIQRAQYRTTVIAQGNFRAGSPAGVSQGRSKTRKDALAAGTKVTVDDQKVAQSKAKKPFVWTAAQSATGWFPAAALRPLHTWDPAEYAKEFSISEENARRIIDQKPFGLEEFMKHSKAMETKADVPAMLRGQGSMVEVATTVEGDRSTRSSTTGWISRTTSTTIHGSSPTPSRTRVWPVSTPTLPSRRRPRWRRSAIHPGWH